MNLIEDLKQLQELRENGVLTEDEFRVAKVRLLEPPEASVCRNTTEKEIQRWRLQVAVAEIDSEWEKEREPYLAYDRFGSSSAPTRHKARLAILTPTIFGVALCCIPGPYFGFQMLGLIILGLTALLYAYCLANVTAYETAFARYRERRAQVIGDADLAACPVP